MRLNFSKVTGTIDVYMDVMRALCGETQGKSMIDLCCCTAPNTPRLGFSTRDYVDMIDRKLDHPQEQQHFMQRDVLSIDPVAEAVHYDVAICSDGIEHLLFPDGEKLLNIMDQLADKRIIFTPTTALFGLAEIEDKDPEAHRSLWTPDWFGERGWFTLVFPDFHPSWDSGAFFAWHDSNNPKDFTRVYEELQTKEWSRLL